MSILVQPFTVSHWLLAGMLFVSLAGCRGASGWNPWSSNALTEAIPAASHSAFEASTADKPAAPPPSDALLSVADQLVTKNSDGAVIDGWYRPLRPASAAEFATAYRWQHDALNGLIEQQRFDLTEALAAEDLSIRSTAAIGLARVLGERRSAALIEIVSARQLSPSLRSAAVETYLKTAPAVQAEKQLAVWFQSHASHVSLHAELLLAGAERFPSQSLPYSIAALDSPSPELRSAALTALALVPQSVPPEAIRLIEDPDLAVRVAAIGLFGSKPTPAATAALCAAARDADLSVRLAAVSALSQQHDLAARETLLEVLAHDGERVRAAAVEALARRGDWNAIRSAVHDGSWLVRREVAAALDHWQTDEDLAAAYLLLEDRSMEVRLQLIESLRRWPLAQAGPLLITAASQRTFAPSQAAMKQLQTRWPPAASITQQAVAADSADAWQQLTAAFAAEFGSDGRRVPAAVVPASVDPATIGGNYADRVAEEFRCASQLSQADLQLRRQAAFQLEQLAIDRPLSDAALARLASVAPADNDPLVWRSLLQAIARNRGPEAAQLAYAALSHPDPETRRRACVYLENHPQPEHAVPLAVSLEERDPRVCLAAIRAFAACAEVENLARLEPLARSPHAEICLAAAVELAGKGHAAGYDALERLAGDPQAGVRRAAVEAMGNLEDPLFLPLLIILLDDRYDVRLAALEALPKVAASDAAPAVNAAASLNERCVAWQRWYARGGSFGNPSGE